MFARFRTVLRAASYKLCSFRRIPRTSASNGGSARQLSLTTGSATLLAGVAGSVVLYKLTTSDAAKIFDSDSLSNYFAELLQQISPCKCMHGPQSLCILRRYHDTDSECMHMLLSWFLHHDACA